MATAERDENLDLVWSRRSQGIGQDRPRRTMALYPDDHAAGEISYVRVERSEDELGSEVPLSSGLSSKAQLFASPCEFCVPVKFLLVNYFVRLEWIRVVDAV